VKEYGPELAGMAWKGAEYIAPPLGPVCEALHTASKALSPHIAKALGENFDRGYNWIQEITPDIEPPRTRLRYRIKSRLRPYGITKKVAPPEEFVRKPGQINGIRAHVSFK
jgi:hypothetical protein